MIRWLRRAGGRALVTAAFAATAGCGGGASHLGSSSAIPPGPTSATATTVRPPASKPSTADWPTYHYSGARAGAIPTGPPLGGVHRLWSAPVDESVYAEPLVVGGRVIVATENNSVYAFVAATGSRRWGVHLGTPVAGADLPCGNIDPSGITGTPVADPTSGTVYVVAYLAGFRHVLFALDMDNGTVRWQRPIDPPGANYKTEQQRAALALSHGRVYVPYGGLYGDCGRYHGWVVGASASGTVGPLITYQVPSQNEGAIWAPPGPALDSQGNLYIATGNGSSSNFDYGNAVIRLTPALEPVSFFAPPDAGALNTTDADLGSTGAQLLAGARVFIMGKSGVAYLLDADHLGGLGNGIVSINLGVAAFGGDAYAHGIIYVPTVGGIIAIQAGSGSLSERWRQSAASQSPIVAGPGIWAIGNGSLYQLDPATGAVRYHASIGDSAHFATPAASDGRVFVAAGGRVQAFAGSGVR